MVIAPELLKMVLLGTEKSDPQAVLSQLPTPIRQLLVENPADTPEQAFFRLAALTLPYQAVGQEFPVISTPAPAPVPDEQQAYVSSAASQLLLAILPTQQPYLIRAWLLLCASRSTIVPPNLLLPLLRCGEEGSIEWQLLVPVLGERGRWLANQRSEWQPVLQSVEERWETGEAKDRRRLLEYLTHHDAARVDALLQATWSQESAAERLRFLEIRSGGPKPIATPWLETLLADRSTKVSEFARTLVLRRPESELAKQVRSQSAELIQLKKGKMLGVGKTTLTIHDEVDLLPLVRLLGLEAESLSKAFSDAAYRAYQVLSVVNPEQWEARLSLSPEKILRAWVGEKSLKKYVPAWAVAINFYRLSSWAEAWLQVVPKSIQYESMDNHTQRLLPLVSAEKVERLLQQKSIRSGIDALELAEHYPGPWSLSLSKTILLLLYEQYADRGVYHYETNRFVALANHLSPDILAQREAFLPKHGERRDTWRTTVQQLFRMIELKTKISASFDD